MNREMFDNDCKITILKVKESTIWTSIKILTLKGAKYATSTFSEDIFNILLQQKAGDKIIELRIPHGKENTIPEYLL